jgi:hypothetical protein
VHIQCASDREKRSILSSVADPDHFDADPDPDPTSEKKPDPDPTDKS